MTFLAVSDVSTRILSAVSYSLSRWTVLSHVDHTAISTRDNCTDSIQDYVRDLTSLRGVMDHRKPCLEIQMLHGISKQRSVREHKTKAVIICSIYNQMKACFF